MCYNHIENHLHPDLSGQVTGTAQFLRINAFAYEFSEQGEFVMPHDTISVYNKYIYTYQPALQTITVYSAQQQVMQQQLFTLNFNATVDEQLFASSAEHLCAADQYVANYSFNLENTIPVLQAIFNVQGPNKNYKSTTTFKLQS